MRIIFFCTILLSFYFSAKTQTSQISISGTKTSSAFNSVKYDPNDGGTINAGYINDSATGNGRDWYIVKLDKDQKVIWQKIIPNAGDDFIYKVIVCANGDYIAVGVLTQSGISRGFVCRLNSSNGNIIWSLVTNNSSIGEIFYDVIETKNGNFAIAGTDSWAINHTNSFFILLNASGNKVWSMISAWSLPDEPYAISQLPNGNLIAGVTEWVGDHYNLVITEFDELTGATLSEKTYSINTTAPVSGTNLNSLECWGINIRNKQVSVYCFAFHGSSSTSSMCIYTYDTTTKNLTGNIYYHTGDVNAISYSYTPVDSSDYLISQSFSSPNRVYISRVKNGSVVYDDLINNSVNEIIGADTSTTDAVYCGNTFLNNHTNTYNLFAPRTNPATTSSCSITNSQTLALQASTLNANTTSDISFTTNGTLNTLLPSYQAAAYTLENICGTVLSATLLNFNASLNNLNKTVQLTWQTTNEINSDDYFEIEHASDSRDFTLIGKIKSDGTAKTANYSFTDVAPVQGLNFYRLRQVDKDGKFVYSKIVSVDLDGTSLFAVYPNPSENNINVIIPRSNNASTLSIYDLNGKKVLEQQLSAGITAKQFDITKLAPGIYNMILMQNVNKLSIKLIKR